MPSANATRLATKIGERERVLSSVLECEKARIALACHAMARAFDGGGTLFSFGTGAAATDAAHVAVEFMHPVIVGKRALPAVAVTNDPTGASALERVGQAGDIALGIAHGADDEAVAAFLAIAGERGLLTIVLWGPGEPPRVDFPFVCPSDDEHVVQEVEETVYHVFWELVHVFFEHPGLFDSAFGAACITCGDVAVAARVVQLDDGFAVIEKDGAREHVAVDLVEGVAVGDVLLCHAGVALEKVS